MADKTVAILQSCYIPWKGFFDIIRQVDEFILYDEVQFTRRDWRNRNLIKTAEGLKWLTIPVINKGHYHAPIRDMLVADPTWAGQHWQSLLHAYRKAACFDEVAPFIEDLYRGCTETRLSEVNRRFIAALCGYLGIDTPLSWSWDYPVQSDDRTQRLVELCRAAGATRYLSGPSAKAYMDLERFHRAGIEVEYMDYSGYPVYRQLHGEFQHGVSVLDLLFNEGREARHFLDRSPQGEKLHG
ncbi:MAG: WbqC family protein [Sulfuricellaceae bacterium]